MSLLHISRAGTSGLSVYRILRRAGDDYRWIIGNGFEAYNAANLTSYAIALTDDGGDVYSADVDFTGAAGRYIGKDYIRSGATPAPDDYPLPGEEVYDWTGTALVSTSHYASTDDVDGVFVGSTNANLWNDGENEGNGTHISAMREISLKMSDSRLNGRVKEKLKVVGKTVTTPVTSTDSQTSETLALVGAFYAAGYAIWRRVGQGTRERPNEGDNFIAMGDELLDALIAADIPGVTLIDLEDDTPGGAGEWTSVPITFEPTCIGDEFAWDGVGGG